jgi:hypothetical protein
MKYQLNQFWPEGAPPCAACGGSMDTTEWSAVGVTVAEYRENRPETAHHLLPDASSGVRGWLPICSDDCERLLYPDEWRTDGYLRLGERLRALRARVRKHVRRRLNRL